MSINSEYEPIPDDSEFPSELLFHINASTPPKFAGYVRCVCVGETYGNNELTVPDGDVYINTGNFTTYDGNDLYQFTQYLQNLSHEYKVIIGGENEHLLAKSVIKALTPATNLYIDGVTTLVKKLRIYSATLITEAGIMFKPFDCYNDIVVSHIAPATILDENEFGESVGSIELLKNLERFPPRVCIFSGNASGGGAMYYKGILCINAGIYQYDRQRNEFIKYGVPLVVDIRVRQDLTT